MSQAQASVSKLKGATGHQLTLTQTGHSPFIFPFEIPLVDSTEMRSNLCVITAPTTWFMEIDDFPCQRPTESHAEYAKEKHLASPFITHMAVQVVFVKSTNRLYKLDGHTRAHLWKNGELEMPSSLLITVWVADELDDARRIYDAFDNKHAAEQTTEKRLGALQEEKIFIRSTLLKNAFATVSSLIVKDDARLRSDLPDRTRDQTSANEQSINMNFAKVWGPHFKAFDAMDLPDSRLKHPQSRPDGKNRFFRVMRKGYTAAAIALVAQYGVEYVSKFLTPYRKSEGNQIAGQKDYITILMEWTEKKVQIGTTGRSENGIDAAQKDFIDFWYCFEMWRRQATHKQLPRWEHDVYPKLTGNIIVKTVTGQNTEAYDFIEERRKNNRSVQTPRSDSLLI